MKNIVIGTAGHIDHGKTTLIKALTGRDTDTLKEEKKRGISINLGFTYFDLPGNKKRVGIVDVPGHEKFIKNMLAGASGLDMVLLVISAEEGVMPQTIEHIDILTYLNIKNGLVVLTKCDSVEEEFTELVKEDIKDKLKGTFLDNCKIIEVDSISKRGIDELINTIDYMTDDIESNKDNSPARLNIDRVFSVKGFGTVITGTLIEGKINLEDELIIYPKGKSVRIRSIQVHGENVNTAYAGQRTAINISNVSVDEVERGDILAAKNSLEESMMIDTTISIVNHYDKELKHWDRLRLYHGTKEILCRAVPLDKELIKASEKGYIQLRLEEPIASKNGDKFVIRTFSPMETIGGGVIIDPIAKKHKRFDDNVIESLKIKEKGSLKDIIEQYLSQNTKDYNSLKDIMIYTGEKEEVIKNELSLLISETKVININSLYIHVGNYTKLEEKILDILYKYHKSNRLKDGILKEELRSKVNKNLKTKDIDEVLNIMNNKELIKLDNNIVSIFDFYVKLNPKQEEIQKEVQLIIRKNGVKNILAISDIAQNNNYKEVVDYMIGKDLEQLDDIHIMYKREYDDLKDKLINYLNDNKEITLGEYRDLTDSSRKNSMIILENFDRNKITKRIENKRILY